MSAPLHDPSTVLAIWCLVAVAGAGIAVLPWSDRELRRSALAWRTAGRLGRAWLAHGVAIARKAATPSPMGACPRLAPATVARTRRRIAT